MYERLVWKLPKGIQKPLKGLAGRILRICAVCSRLSPASRIRIARLLGIRLGQTLRTLESIPSDRLGRTVLFLSLRPHTREVKLAEAARFAGWNPVLIHADELRFDAGKYFELHARVGGLFDLVLISWLFRGPLIHLFAPDGAQAYLPCVSRTRPLILDINDTCKSHLAQSQPRVWEQCERDAIRSSSGMTHRDLRVKYLHELYGYPLPRHNTLMVDLVPEVAPRLGKRFSDGEIHVVSVGWVGRGDSSIERIIRALSEAGIHVHLYINPLQRETDPDIEGYARLRDELPRFHFERPAFGEDYWDQLSQYDFGISVSERLVFNEPLTSVTKDSLEGAGSSRLTDYLLAGLGVIISPGLKFQWVLARRYASVVITADRSFLKNPRPVLEAALARKLEAKPKSLFPITTRGTARRLGEFYSKVARESPV